MFSVEAEWRVFSGALDELRLWELPGRHTYVQSSGKTVTPDVPQSETRAFLAHALAGGLVELYDGDTPGYPRVPVGEALELIAENGEWAATTASRNVMLAITEAGARASHQTFARLRAASPFRAVGATDPQVFDKDD